MIAPNNYTVSRRFVALQRGYCMRLGSTHLSRKGMLLAVTRSLISCRSGTELMNMKPMFRIAFLMIAILTIVFSAAAQQAAPAKAVTGPTEFTIGGAVKAPLTVTAADMKQMPRKTISVVNAHNG